MENEELKVMASEISKSPAKHFVIAYKAGVTDIDFYNILLKLMHSDIVLNDMIEVQTVYERIIQDYKNFIYESIIND